MEKSRSVIISDGQTYKPGEEPWDLGSFVCVESSGNIRKYEGLSKDAPDKLPHYVASGSTAFCLDTGDFYKYHSQSDTWYLI